MNENVMSYKITDSLPRWIVRLMYAVGAVIFVFCLIALCVYKKNYLALPIAALLMLCARRAASAVRTDSDAAALRIVILASLAVYTLYDILVPAVPDNDYRLMMESVSSLHDGTFWNRCRDITDYFYYYNYQIGYMLYMYLIDLAARGNLVVFRGAEALVLTLTNVVFYKLVRTAWPVRKSLFCALAWLFFLPVILGCGVINNQHLSALFLMLFLYLLARKEHRLSGCILAGVCIAFSVIFRPSALVMIYGYALLMGVMILTDLTVRRGQKGHDWKRKLAELALVAASYAVVYYGFNAILILGFGTPYGVGSNPSDAVKFVEGLNNTRGTVTGYDGPGDALYYDLQSMGFDYEKYRITAKEFLLSPGGIKPAFILKRLLYYFGDVDNMYGAIGILGKYTEPRTLFVLVLAVAGDRHVHDLPGIYSRFGLCAQKNERGILLLPAVLRRAYLYRKPDTVQVRTVYLSLSDGHACPV
jgi:hypothetical protein